MDSFVNNVDDLRHDMLMTRAKDKVKSYLQSTQEYRYENFADGVYDDIAIPQGPDMIKT